MAEGPTRSDRGQVQWLLHTWGSTNYAQQVGGEGFVPVPRTLIRMAGQLGLTAREILFLLCYACEARRPQGYPPDYVHIGECLGLERVTVSAVAHSLVAKGLVRVVGKDGHANVFDFGPLLAALGELTGGKRAPHRGRPTLVRRGRRPAGRP